MATMTLPWPIILLAAVIIVAVLARAALQGLVIQRVADVVIAFGFGMLVMGRPMIGFWAVSLAFAVRLVVKTSLTVRPRKHL